MPRKVQLRELTEPEKQEIAQIAKSRTEPIRRVQRARIIQALLDQPQLGAAEAGRLAGYQSDAAGVHWVKRYNAQGLAGLDDEARSGRPPTNDPSVRSALISLAQQKPESLGYPFKLWTLERLQTAFQERQQVHLSDSTIWEWVEAEGFRWKRQESWFHNAEQHDAEFVEKRGASSPPI